MFAKNKVSQAVIDAVNSVLEIKVEEKNTTQPSDSQRVPMAPASTVTTLSEASEKVPTTTGMKVYGSSYGNSAKARKDQTKSAVDTLKGPKDKEMKEAAKPDFLDMDKDGNKKESMKKAIADKEMKEELKGNQHKIDANKNNKIDAQDFKILRNKKVKEDMHFANKLLETVRKSDVPAYLRKAKGDTPLTMADVKGPKKDSISAPENLAKAKNEEVDLTESDLHGMAYKHGWTHKPNTYGAELHHPKHGSIGIDRYGEWYHHDNETKATGKVKAHGKYDTLEKHLSSLKEEKESCGDEVKKHEKRMHGKDGEVSKHVSKMHKSVSEELTEEQLDEMLNEVLGKDATAGDWISDFIHSDNPKFAGKSKAERKKMALGAYYGQKNEATIAGLSGWKKMKKDVKDKSGAVHTPMSRARDLAQAAFKKIQKEVK